MNHYWDQEEPRLLVCEAKRIAPSSNSFSTAFAFNRQTSYGSTNHQPITVSISRLVDCIIYHASSTFVIPYCFMPFCI